KDDSLRKTLDNYLSTEAPEKQAAWEKTANLAPTQWTELTPGKAVATSSKLRIQKDKSVLAAGKAPDKDTYTVEIDAGETHGVTGFRLEPLPESAKRPIVGRSKTYNFVLTGFKVKLVTADNTSGIPVELSTATADFTQSSFSPQSVLTATDKKSGWAIVP